MVYILLFRKTSEYDNIMLDLQTCFESKIR